MPFESEKQKRWMWANEPEIAQRWSDKYGSKVRSKKSKKRKNKKKRKPMEYFEKRES